MNAIVVQFIQGSQTGKRAKFTQSSVTFGRGNECDLIVDLPLASRKHGSLIYQNDQWYLVNESANGTTINGKKTGNRPKALAHGDIVGVAGEGMFAVGFEEVDDDAVVITDEQQGQTIEKTDSTSKRSKLWIGIGIYLAVALVVVLVLSSINPSDNSNKSKIKLLSEADITAAISAPLKMQKNESVGDEKRREGRRIYDSRHLSDKNLYNTWRAYKEALAQLDKTSFDLENNIDNLNFEKVEQEMIAHVYRKYNDCYKYYKGQDWKRAERALLRFVREVFPDHQSPIYKNANRMLTYTKRRTS